MKLDVKFRESTEHFQVSFYEHNEQFAADLGEIHIVTEHVGGKLYEGDYAVTPKLESQTMATKGKVMGEDVTIKEIPITAVSNSSGGRTVIIGG